jgi:hypothetical protein
MFKLLKNLIKSVKPAPLLLMYDAIPAWLENREGMQYRLLSSNTASPIGVVREAVNNLGEIVQTLRAAEYNEEIHPKLKSIAKNTLPQFAKAMETALSKPLPDDVEGFYSTATEILKGCINSSRGQGKYLQTVFPKEMKTVRTGIDTIGHEINAMNETLAPYRIEMEKITEARKIHEALSDIKNDTVKSYAKESRIEQRIHDTRTRIGECEQELASLERDEAQGQLAEKHRALRSMIEERDGVIRRYAALSMTASHVLRKAEKLAHKQHRKSDEAVLIHAMDILSDHTVPDAAYLAQTLTAACTITVTMIQSGDVSLKNKEERTLFSDTGGFISEVRQLSEKYTDLAKMCDEAEHSFRSHPIVARTENRAREKNQLEVILEKEHQSLKDLITWRKDLQQSITSLQEKLKKTLGEISGNDVQILYSDFFSPLQ